MARRTQYLPTFAPDLGFKVDTPETMLDRRFTPKSKNIMFRDGVVESRTGYPLFSTKPVKMVGSILRYEQLYKQGGSSFLVAFTTRNIYKWDTVLSSWQVITRNQELEDCETAWAEQVAAGVTVTTNSTDKIRGGKCNSFALAAAFTTGIIASEARTAIDISGRSHVHFYIKSNINTSAGDLRLLLDNTPLAPSPMEILELPALVAGEWTAVSVALTNQSSDTAIVSIALQRLVNLGVQTILLDDIRATTEYVGNLSHRWSVTTYLDKMYATNNIDLIQEWDGGQPTTTDLTNTIRCRVIVSYKDRLHALDVEDAGTRVPQRIKFTPVGSTSFSGPGSGTTDIAQTPDGIRNAIPRGDSLVVYKERHVVEMQHIGGVEIYRLDYRIHNNGLIGQESVVDLGDIHTFFSSDNFLAYFGGLTYDPIGNNIQKDVYSRLTDTSAQTIFSVLVKELNEVWYFLPLDAATSPNFFYRYNYFKKSWSPGTFFHTITGAGLFQEQNVFTWGSMTGSWGSHTEAWGTRAVLPALPVVLLGDTNGYTYEVDLATYNDNGQIIESYFDTADIIPSEEYVHSFYRYNEFRFEAKGTSVDVYISGDLGVTYTFLKTITLTSAFLPYVTFFERTKKKLRFRLYKNVLSANWAAREFAVGFIKRTDR